jgi:hypothetical protein
VSRALLFTACSFCALVACSDDDDEPRPLQPAPPRATGTLEYHWSINGQQVAENCEDVGALLFESVVFDEGFVVDGVSAPCEDFQLSLPLYRDDFLTRSSLTDARGYPALRRVIEDIVVIAEDEVTTLFLDFPSAALAAEPPPDAGAPSSVDAGLMPEPPDPGDGVADAGADGG